jgi:hypothetical protein
LEKILQANDGIGPLFVSKSLMVQFQAADLLAWKSRKVLAQVVQYDGPGDAEAHDSIQRSLAEIKTIPNSFGMHVYERMEKLAVRANLPKR